MQVINQDILQARLKDKSLVYGKNIKVSEDYESLTNSIGNSLITKLNKKNRVINGVINTLDYTIIFAVPDNDNFNNTELDIFVFDNNEEILREVQFEKEYSFTTSKYFPIIGEYYLNNNEECIIVFISDIDEPRLLNIGDLKDPSVTQDSTSFLFNELTIGNISNIEVLDNAGSLKSGTYFIGYKYANDDYESEVLNYSKPIWITKDKKSLGFDQYDGVSSDTETDKAIKVVFDNLDTSYQFIIPVIIRLINNTYQPVELPKINLSSNSVEYLYNGNESIIELSLQEALVNNVSYNKAKAITKYDNRLYLGNLETAKQTIYQELVNHIHIDYTTELVNLNNIEESNKTNLNKTFMYGEVYAFYIQFIDNKGGTSLIYHIPGRPIEAGESDNITVDGQSFKKFQIEDTSNSSYNFSNMAYWENDEEYIGRYFPTGKVRHHKFPDLKAIKDNNYPSEDIGTNVLPKLGIKIKNVVIPDEYVSYRVFYAKRNYSNATVVGSDIILHGGTHSNEYPTSGVRGNEIWNTGGNWDISAELAGNRDWQDMFLKKDIVRLHSIDVLLNNPSVSYIDKQFKVETNQELSDLIRISGNGTLVIGGVEKAKSQFTSYILDYTRGKNVDYNITNRVNFLEDYKLLPQHTRTVEYNNLLSEKAGIAKISTATDLNPGDRDLLINSVNESRPSGLLFNEDTYWILLRNVKNEVYNAFYNQELISISELNVKESYEGDCFLGVHDFITLAPRHFDDEDPTLGIRMFRRVGNISSINTGLKYETEELGSKYYPETEAEDLYDKIQSDRDFVNTYEYNRDYSALNEFNSGSIYSNLIELNNKFPYRIANSDVNNEESNDLNWKTFRANAYYEQPKNKGEIINLETWGDILLIHHKYSLYKSRPSQTLQTDLETVSLGNTTLFNPKPVEVLFYNGGTNSNLSCVKTEIGYLFVDDNEGSVYLFNGEINKLSDQGLKHYFRNNLPFIYYEAVEKRERIQVDICERKFKLPLVYNQGVVNAQKGFILIDSTKVIIEHIEIDNHNLVYTINEDIVGLHEINVPVIYYKPIKFYPNNPYQERGYTLDYDKEYNNIHLVKNNKNPLIIEENTITTCEDITVTNNWGIDYTPTWQVVEGEGPTCYTSQVVNYEETVNVCKEKTVYQIKSDDTNNECEFLFDQSIEFPVIEPVSNCVMTINSSSNWDLRPPGAGNAGYQSYPITARTNLMAVLVSFKFATKLEIVKGLTVLASTSTTGNINSGFETSTVEGQVASPNNWYLDENSTVPNMISDFESINNVTLSAGVNINNWQQIIWINSIPGERYNLRFNITDDNAFDIRYMILMQSCNNS